MVDGRRMQRGVGGGHEPESSTAGEAAQRSEK